MPHLTFSKKKSFHTKEESMCPSYEVKRPKCKQPLNISQNSIYKQGLDFYRPSKILCQTSGRQNHCSLLRRKGAHGSHKHIHFCRTILMKVTYMYMRRIALWIAFYIPYSTYSFYVSLHAAYFRAYTVHKVQYMSNTVNAYA